MDLINRQDALSSLTYWSCRFLSSPCYRFRSSYNCFNPYQEHDARGTKLIPDKKDLGYAFPCDGPGRGGTCDSSSWDAMYLAMFWALNLLAWVTFYWHWKHLAIWQVTLHNLMNQELI